MGYCAFSFSNLTFGVYGFHLKKVKNNSIRFLNWRAGETLLVNNKGNRMFMSRNYRSDSRPFDVLKTGIIALEASLLGPIVVLRTSNFREATISQ